MLVLANIFQPLIDFFEAILKFFHDTVGTGWGVSIILMTVVIRAALVPLAVRQFHSMQRMQRLQPQMKALQAKYKDDKQRLNQEMMNLYRENKVNPFASCLPMVLQLPVFISLFYMLRHDLRKDICPEVQHLAHTTHNAAKHWPIGAGKTTPCGAGHDAGFLLIHDLTNKATGTVLVVLILLYIGSQLSSSLVMTTTMDKTQRNMMLLLPLVFVTFVFRFPAGLILYWITTNLWTLLQQYIVKSRVGSLQPATVGASPPAEGGSRGGLAGLLGGGSRASSGAAASGSGAAEAPAATKTKAATGGKTASNGGGDGRAKPPPPPRKKKKRSGRRR